jgi:hypothetical protein
MLCWVARMPGQASILCYKGVPLATPVFDEPAIAHFRWLKRIACTLAVLIVLLILSRLWWGWIAERRFQAEIAAIRARGEPALLADFVDPQIPEEENAATHVRRAFDISPRPAGAISLSHWAARSVKDTRMLQQWVHENKRALVHLQSARECAHVSCQSDYRSISRDDVDNDFCLRANRLFDLLKTAALLAHYEAADDASAIQRIRDMMLLARTIDCEPEWYRHRFARGVRATCAHTLTMDIIPTLQLLV